MEAVARSPIAVIHLARLILCALCAIVLLDSPVQAKTQSRLAVCNSCFSKYSFQSAAEQSSFDYSPSLEGVDQVYVLNPNTADIHYFDVHRWYEAGDVDPYSAPESGGQIRGTLYGYYHAEAEPAAGDPVVEAALIEGLNAAKSFAQGLLGSIDINDVDPASHIDSAIDLVGPDDSAAGLNRNGLRNLLNNYYNSMWAEQVFALTDLGRRFVDKILARSQLLVGAVITISFEDGTTIKVKLESIAEGMDGGPLYMDLEVMQDTARGPGLWMVPVSEGQFDNFSYTGDSNTVQALINLALRYGIPVTGSGGGSGGTTMECEVDGDTIRCTVSGSSY